MLDEGGEVGDLAVLAGAFDLPELLWVSASWGKHAELRLREAYPDVVIATRSGQTALSVGLEVGGVDGGVVVVPGDEQWSSLHGG